MIGFMWHISYHNPDLKYWAHGYDEHSRDAHVHLLSDTTYQSLRYSLEGILSLDRISLGSIYPEISYLIRVSVKARIYTVQYSAG